MKQHHPEPSSGVAPSGSDGEHQVQRELGSTGRAARFYEDQMRDRLNPRMREFIGRQEMFFLSTSDRRGECDSSFRAGPPGFVRVLDDATIAYPEYRGNGVHASLGNIRENPHVALLMIDFGRDRIGLHVNGRARLVTDELMRIWRPELPVDPMPGRRPQIWVEVNIEEAYIHCSKHIPHLVKAAPPGAGPRAGADGGRAWGTDDVKRKGGDYFGAAAERRAARAGVAVTTTAVEPVVRQIVEPALEQVVEAALEPAKASGRVELLVRTERADRAVRAGLPDPDMWRREAERALAAAYERGQDSVAEPVRGGRDGEGRSWFG